ncbi:hypothetical protein K443DRAFT_684032 [Laccaria amethystina LaAM-08-1]|uniref:Uncharacterized protein n=1 Tax=Laccaria amethystina LaAM-08-1 TaxID=1095629 RepID=A0A0C9WYP9_9AGAR|nr:hypothetical protein K443DRAFT_684032 [Laccaria amethystina LaAM-08-1]
MVILSIIPSDLVRVGAITLGSIVFLFNIARAVRPRVLMQKLQVRLLSLEGKLQTAVDENIMAETDANYIAQFERSVGRIRYRVSELHEKMLLAYGILQEMMAVWRGHSFEIFVCIRDVEALEWEIEIKRATELKNRYYLWQ